MHNTEILKRKLMGLEKKYWQAMRDKDLAAALSLTDFPCVVASAHGARTIDRRQFEEMFNSQKGQIGTLNFGSNPQVRMLNDDTAVIAYEIHGTMKAENAERKLDAIDTSTWVKRGENWLCAMHTEIESAAKP